MTTRHCGNKSTRPILLLRLISSIATIHIFILSYTSLLVFAHAFSIQSTNNNHNKNDGPSPSPSPSPLKPVPVLAPERTPTQIANVKHILDIIYGTEKSDQWEARRHAARSTTTTTTTTITQNIKDDDDKEDNNSNNPPPPPPPSSSSLRRNLNLSREELVYGELGLDALVTILDAVGIRKNDRFLDVGSGDGMLVLGASLLYPEYLRHSRGIEVVKDIYDRSVSFGDRLMEDVGKEEGGGGGGWRYPKISFDLGNVYEPDEGIRRIFADTTIAVCFATTWSKGIPGKKLEKLSKALGVGGRSELPSGARVVVIDGVLNSREDGFEYGGEFKLYCPDTLPYSIARLYTKK